MSEAKQLRFWAIRWSVPSSDPSLVASFSAALQTCFDKFVFQLECTRPIVIRDDGLPEVKENWHYQCFAHSNVSTRKFTLVRGLEAHGPGFRGIHIEPASTPGIKALQSYCMKRDSTYVAGPWNEDGLMASYELPYDASDLKVISDSPYPWQKKILAIMDQEPDPRKIYWIYDPVGSAGKSDFTKYCAFHRGAQFMGWAKYADAANLVYKAKKRHIFIFDLTRSKPRDFSDGDIYSAIESVKSGMINNTKYETETVFFRKPHVVVFSNDQPNLKKLSADRWQIYEITPDKDIDVIENLKRRKV